MTPNDSADAIRKRMAELRCELTTDVRDVGRSAREMANPLYYFRRYPWASIAVATVAGYLLVPKKREVKVIRPDPDMLAELVRKQQVNVDTTKAANDSGGLVRSLVAMGLTWGLRTGLTYMGQRLTAGAVQKAHPEPEPASSSEEPWNPSR